ncbi:MAG: EpsI family protein [Gemmatimonadales bacterium]
MGAPFVTGRRVWWPSMLLGVGCLLNFSVAAQRTMELQAPLTTLPRELGGYTGEDLPIPDDQARVAAASSSLLRLYTRDSANFSVYVGFYARQRQGQTIHSPKNCLPGSGWEPLASRREVVPTPDGEIRANRFLIANRSEQALVYYWYQGRGRTESNEYKVKVDLVRDAALRRRSEESLVRVVVPLPTDTTRFGAADSLARAVAVEVHHALQSILPD